MSYLRRYVPAFTLVLAITAFYLYGLSGVGVLDPDEPRYLAIGRAMLRSGDFVTPRLWGVPWFEKPPLLYWMTSLGNALSLGPEETGRLPVALLSLAFLAAMFELLRREFGVEAAAISSVLLATSAGWIVYSSFALTDLPLAVFFSLAVFCALPSLRSAGGKSPALRFVLIGVCLGLATLAKGLVPLVLAIPFAWFLRRAWRKWWLAISAAVVVALPWYAAMYARHGRPFLEDFFWKHHVERLYSASLLHAQPFWYYLPVFLAAIFPWTPLLLLLAFHHENWDERRRFLTSIFLFGLVAFSLSLNKLPGYLLPLLPAVFAVIGTAVDWKRLVHSFRWWLMPCALLIGLLPVVARALPQALQAGRLAIPHTFNPGPTTLFYMACPAAAVLLARRTWTGILLVLCMVAGGFFLKIVSYPVLDRMVSARGLFGQVRQIHGSVCTNWLNRDLLYGLEFYRDEPFPQCVPGQFDFGLESHGRNMQVVRRDK